MLYMTIWLSLSDWMLNLRLTLSQPASPPKKKKEEEEENTNRCHTYLTEDSLEINTSLTSMTTHIWDNPDLIISDMND